MGRVNRSRSLAAFPVLALVGNVNHPGAGQLSGGDIEKFAQAYVTKDP